MFSNQHINFFYLFVCMICFSLITYYKKYWENSLWIFTAPKPSWSLSWMVPSIMIARGKNRMPSALLFWRAMTCGCFGFPTMRSIGTFKVCVSLLMRQSKALCLNEQGDMIGWPSAVSQGKEKPPLWRRGAAAISGGTAGQRKAPLVQRGDSMAKPCRGIVKPNKFTPPDHMNQKGSPSGSLFCLASFCCFVRQHNMGAASRCRRRKNFHG